jgi:CPA1 family monovalent cation:H+ antiporter
VHDVELILGLLLAVAALAWLASRLKISYPIFLVLGGLALGFVPRLPSIRVQPDLVFLLFLPPVLYYAALLTSWRDFKANLRPIGLLAIGLVLFTTFLTAAVAHWLIPGMSWGVAFVLGAIISPPDAVAATAVAQRLHLPKRIVTILEGESLVNDASALIAYRVAVAAVAGTTRFGGQIEFLSGAGVQFFVAAAGGIAVGLLAGVVVAWVRPRLHEDSVELAVSLLTPYVAYLPAEWLHLSSVLSVVTCGLYLSRRINQITTARVRLRAYATWDTLVFLLNGLIFILIGLELPEVVARLDDTSVRRAAWYAAVISAVAIAVRMLWVFPATYLPRWLSSTLRRRDPAPPWQAVFVIAWTGMRGIVSLAAALALPLTLADGTTPFPYRDLILFITFGVILATLVLQGLTLPWVIGRLKLSDPAEARDEEEITARYLGALAAVERLDNLAALRPEAKDRLDRMRATYDERVAYYSRQLTPPDGDGKGAADAADDAQVVACETGVQIEREAIAAERQMVVRLRDQGVIGDEVLRRIQAELDHEESRLSE